MAVFQVFLIIAGLAVCWGIYLKRAHQSMGPAQAKLVSAYAALALAAMSKASAFVVNYYLASTGLMKILGAEYFERDPMLKVVFAGTHVAAAHLMAIFIIISSFALASAFLDSGRQVLLAAAARAWQTQQSRFIQDAAKFAVLAALSYVVIIHLDTNLMLFRTATMLFMNELGAATPGEMLDLPSIYQRFQGTAGVWILHVLSLAYPAMIMGTTLLFASARKRLEQAIGEAVAEEDALNAFDDDEEDVADDDILGNVPAPPAPVLGQAPAAVDPAPRWPRIRFPFGGAPWHRPVPQNNGGMPGDGEADAA